MKNRIKQLRRNRGIGQTVLALEIGITQQTLSNYEHDIGLIKAEILKKLAQYFDVTTDYLLGISAVKKNTEELYKGSRYSMIRIAICDDEMSITEEMALQLQHIAKQNYTDVEIEVFWNGESLVKAVKENACFDAVFLDIEMSGENGITAAKEV